MLSIDEDLVRELIEKNVRLDGRKFTEFRNIKIENNIVPLAEGSAQVEIGDTKIIAGVKLDLGEPFPDRDDEGVIITNAEFVQFGHPEFESGPPGEQSIEVARVVDRAIRECDAVDMKKLCIEKGKKVWMLFIDLDVLDHDGNLLDAASLAAMAALKNAKMPGLIVEEDNGEKKYTVDFDNKKEKLPLEKTPINVTVAKINDALIIDPSLMEEAAIDAKITFGFAEEGLCSMQKGGVGGVTTEEFFKMYEVAENATKELRKKL
jgi:exosome complex component RRP42